MLLPGQAWILQIPPELPSMLTTHPTETILLTSMLVSRVLKLSSPVLVI